MPSHNLPRERRTPSQRCREGSCLGIDTGAALGPVNGAEPGKKGSQGQEATPSPVSKHGAVWGYLGTKDFATSRAHPPGTVPFEALSCSMDGA